MAVKNKVTANDLNFLQTKLIEMLNIKHTRKMFTIFET